MLPDRTWGISVTTLETTHSGVADFVLQGLQLFTESAALRALRAGRGGFLKRRCFSLSDKEKSSNTLTRERF